MISRIFLKLIAVRVAVILVRWRRARDADDGDGVVKWFNAVQAFGVVQPLDGGRDVVVRIAAVQAARRQSLEEG
jgi:hypothetical protein